MPRFYLLDTEGRSGKQRFTLTRELTVILHLPITGMFYSVNQSAGLILGFLRELYSQQRCLGRLLQALV